MPSLKFNYRVFVEGMERTYKKELMFVIDAEDLAANGERVMKRAFRFVGPTQRLCVCVCVCRVCVCVSLTFRQACSTQSAYRQCCTITP